MGCIQGTAAGKDLDPGFDNWHLASWDIHGWLSISRFSFMGELYLYEEDDWTLVLPFRGHIVRPFLAGVKTRLQRSNT